MRPSGGEYLQLFFCPVCCLLAVLPLLSTFLSVPSFFWMSSLFPVIFISSKWDLWPSPLPRRSFLSQDLAGCGIWSIASPLREADALLSEQILSCLHLAASLGSRAKRGFRAEGQREHFIRGGWMQAMAAASRGIQPQQTNADGWGCLVSGWQATDRHLC